MIKQYEQIKLVPNDLVCGKIQGVTNLPPLKMNLVLEIRKGRRRDEGTLSSNHPLVPKWLPPLNNAFNELCTF